MSFINIQKTSTHIIYIHIHTYTYVYIHILTYAYICTHIHTDTYIHIHTNTSKYTQIHACTYTHIRIHIFAYTRGVYPPQDLWRKFPPNLIGHRSFMELDFQIFSPWGNCKRRRHDAAIAEGKKPLPARGSGERRKLLRGVWGGAPETVRILNISCQKVHFGIFLISYLLTIKSKNSSWSGGQSDETDYICFF